MKLPCRGGWRHEVAIRCAVVSKGDVSTSRGRAGARAPPRCDRHGRQRAVGAAPGLKRTEGHAAGEEALFDTVEGALEIGLQWMTVYAFSTENWRRPLDEVRFLMNFNERLLVARRDELNGKGVRVRFIGRRAGRVPRPGAAPHRGDRGAHRAQPPADAHVRVQLRRPGRARRAIREDRARGGRRPARSREDRRATVHRHSTRPTCPIPISRAHVGRAPDLELLAVAAAYSELLFTDVLWPDFRRKHLFRAVDEYQQRERRSARV